MNNALQRARIALHMPLLLKDCYKIGHPHQYPKGIQRVLSNLTPRTSRVKNCKELSFFGLQYFIKKYLIEDMQNWFFDLPREEAVGIYSEYVKKFLGGDMDVSHIAALHDLGYLPLKISALPEGTRCPLRVPCLLIENTHDDFGWLPNLFETVLSATLWGPCTSATTARKFRELLNRYANATTDRAQQNPAICSGADFCDWQGHDFSMRGMFGIEASILSGMGHLLSFTGTDTIPAVSAIDFYYAEKMGPVLIGASVPATEHSVMCAGSKENEFETYSRLLDIYPSGIVSIVSDTWDLWKVITDILPRLKDRIMTRNGKTVCRPDSGDPANILCGDPWALVGTPQQKGVIELLWDVFGGTINSKGYKVLDPHIGAIYGDAIRYDTADEILRRLQEKGFASTNIVFGCGSFTYQFVTRDTYGLAVKATWCQINGVGIDLFKQPVTDNGIKNSACGRLAVVENEGTLELVQHASPDDEARSLLQPVYLNGKLLREWSFSEIRANHWRV